MRKSLKKRSFEEVCNAAPGIRLQMRFEMVLYQFLFRIRASMMQNIVYGKVIRKSKRKPTGMVININGSLIL